MVGILYEKLPPDACHYIGCFATSGTYGLLGALKLDAVIKGRPPIACVNMVVRK